MNLNALKAAASVCALMALPVAASAQDETLEQVASAFGARQSVLDVSLSPSGTKLAVIVPGGPSAEVVQIIDLASDAPARDIFPFAEENAELRRCDWANEDFLVCEAYVISAVDGLLLGANRIFSLAADGSKFEMLSAESSAYAMEYNQDGGHVLALDVAGEDNSILMTRDFLQERTTGSRSRGRVGEGLGVEIVDVSTGRRRRIENPDPNIRDYWADEHGRVRLRVRQERDPSGALRSDRHYSYRPADSDGWDTLSRTGTDSDDPYFQPVAVDSGRNRAYGFGYHDGFAELYAAALDGSGDF